MISQSKKRIYWIDIAKAIAILCIVFGHTLRGGIAQIIVYSFHVPTFFLLSGMTFREKTFKEQIKSDFLRILVPYFSFGIISILIFFFLGKFAASQLQLDVDISLGNNLWGLIYANPSVQDMKFNMPLWFLPCLFITKTVFNLLCKLLRKKEMLVFGCVIIAAVSFVYSSLNGPDLPFNISVALKMLMFFSLGRIFVLNISTIENCFNKAHKALFAGIALLAIASVVACFNSKIGYYIDDFNNITLFLITSVTGSFGVCFFSMGIGRCRVLEYVGKKTLSILVMHKFPVLLFQTVGPQKNILMQYDTMLGIVASLVVAVIAIIMCLIADWIINKIAPFLLGDFFTY